MATSAKRPERIAWASLILNVIFFGLAFFLGRWSGFFAVSTIGYFILFVVLIWFVLAIQFHQRALAEQEKLDMGRLAEEKKDSTIFQAGGERSSLFVAAQHRLDILEKWFIPIFSALIAAYQLAIGFYLLKSIPGQAHLETKQPLLCAICMTSIAFISFLISRYATGLSNQPQWKPLRAGGSGALGIAVLCFALAIGLALERFQISTMISIINYVVPILLIVLGAETTLNVILDLYRPRLKGQYSRSAFDSRLLGIINEPGGIFRSAASALDYQFGFEVSQTWFYKLLEKAIVPLIIFAAVTLHLISCVVVVGPDEEAIIERFGNPVTGDKQVRQVGPGLAFKWPWPIDIAYKYPTKQIMELSIGYVPKTDPDTGEQIREKHLLWGEAHYEEEYNVLVASEYTGDDLTEGAVPVSLVKANVPVQYRIKDLYSYLYSHSDPPKLLEAICYHELAKFAASATVEVDGQGLGSSAPRESLLGAGRARAKSILTQRIQEAADEQDLGVEIVFVGLQGVHPPPEVATDYQAVIGAVQRRQALVLEAHAEANKNLSTLVGSVREADELYDLAAKYQQVKQSDSQEDIEKLGKALDTAFAQARGDIFKTLRQSQSYAFERATLARATGERFASQLKAYKAAKEIYKREQRLIVFEEALKNIRKFVVAAGVDDREVIIVDFQEKLTPSLYDIGGFEESSKK
jgi:membrane protease subunit HflK